MLTKPGWLAGKSMSSSNLPKTHFQEHSGISLGCFGGATTWQALDIMAHEGSRGASHRNDQNKNCKPEI